MQNKFYPVISVMDELSIIFIFVKLHKINKNIQKPKDNVLILIVIYKFIRHGV